ncbi:MAG: BACON domain-containing protein, partial [Bacteroidales bacterium]
AEATVTQAGATPYLDVSPNNQNVYGFADNTTFNVDANVGWNVTDDADWLTATKTDGSTITVAYEDNHSSGERTAHITATGTGGVTETVTLTQMIYPYLIITSDSWNVSAASGSTTFSVDSNMEWGITNYNATWLVATKTDANTISVTYEENTSTSGRTAEITVVATVAVVTLTFNQAGATPYLDVSPNSQDVGAAAGSSTFSVNTNVEWSVTDDADWLSANRTHGNNISVSYDENNSTYDRTANITVTGTGRLSETVTVTQAGGTTYLDISPNIYIVGGLAGSVTFSVSTNVGWSITDDADWLTATKTDGSTITVNYEEFLSADNLTRSASITASGTGGVSETVTITQESSNKVADISAGPGNRNVSAAAGSTTFRVIASGDAWSLIPANDGATWLTAVKSNDTTITATYDENTSGISRIGKICVTAPWMSGQTMDLTVTQSETSAYLDIFPTSKLVSKASGRYTFSVSTNIDWDVTDDVTWLTATRIDQSSFLVAYGDNTPNVQRTANILVTGSEGISKTVTLTQAGETPYLEIFPTSKLVGTGSGSTTFSVSTNVDWSVTDDVSWLTATKTDASTISVSYEENISASQRTAHITATGAEGVTETITVSQAGTSTYLDVSPNSQTMGPKAGSTTFSVSSSVGWNVTDDADWLTATKTDGSTISVTYDENPDPYNSRTANITATGTGGVTETVTLTQSANKYSWYLAIIPTYKNVSSDLGTTTFSVVTNLQWSVTDDAEWLDASKSNDSIIFVFYDGNASPTNRTATITVTGVATGGGLDPMVLCTVTQAEASSYLVVTPDIKSAGTSAGSTTFSVNCNKAWSVTDDADWLTATKSNDSTISVTYDANSSSDSRKAYIEAKSDEPGLSVTSWVIQAGTSTYLDVFPDYKTVDAAAGSTTFSVSSNVEWSVTEEADWLTATKTDAGTLTVTYDANTSTDVRGVDIMVTGTGVTGKTVEVIQTGSDLYLDASPGNIVVGAASGSATFSVSSNVEWSVANDAEWLTVTKTDGSTIDASYEPNASIDARTASFTVSGTEGVADTVTITQEGEYI